MPRSLISASAALLVLGFKAGAQPPWFHGPTVGYVYHQASQTIRPVLGVPGSSYVGSPVLSGMDFASVSPGGEWALITKGGRSTFVSGLSHGLDEAETRGLLDAIDRVAWSRDGAFALVYSSSRGQLQRVRLSAREAIADAPVAWAPAGQVTTMAIDPLGRQIAAGVANVGLYLLDKDGPLALLSRMEPAVVAFDHTGRTLYAAVLESRQILEFESASGPAVFAALGDASSPSADPAGLAASDDGRYLLLADRASREVRVYETASRTLTNSIPLEFAPSRLESLSRGSTFLLNGDKSSEWLLLLDTRQVPAVYFVPTRREEPL
jgi:hypothetical protein